jgi:hypothetical protein
MKHFYLFMLTLCLLTVIGCKPSATTGQVAGQASWPDSGQAVPEVAVSLSLSPETDDEVRIKATTDAKGAYAFPELKPGAYTPSFSFVPDTLDSPCSDFSVHPSMGESWINVSGTREDGSEILMIISMAKIDIAAGDDLKLNLEFECQ